MTGTVESKDNENATGRLTSDSKKDENTADANVLQPHRMIITSKATASAELVRLENAHTRAKEQREQR